MKSAAAIIMLWTTIALLLHHTEAESGYPGVESGLNTINAGNAIVKSGSDTDRPTRKKRNSLTDALQAIWCDDPLTTLGCRECEKSCAKPNPSVFCAQGCQNTCICKPGLYATGLPSPKCAPPNGPLLNNCEASRQLRNGQTQRRKG
ncbi:uncharacterized protein LOC129593036 [Paramacrobiotus metropolitanus]|uniref:uncharacterized protein LOC129593036 n=1 Tax=Paramacrobiotus metropolitanus TaxID=2943436 RepID=UPI0024460066|nr:uncharacterized protein LOC129593036 [Paramacrobiotus metropolitanus]